MRSESWTYGSFGKLLSSVAADGSISSIEYYADDDAAPERRGQVSAMVNALGQRVSISEYDARGNPSVIVDEGGVAASMAYDERGRMVSSSRLGASETRAYDVAGQLVSVALSNGLSMTFSYDQAHRLIGAASSNGESIAYAYDAAGNRVQDAVSSGQALSVQVNRIFSALGQVTGVWGADASKKRVLNHNAKGELASTVDPLNRTSTFSYDALGRMISHSDKGMNSSTPRDADGNLKSYSGGGVKYTYYTWNDYREPMTISGPDAGLQTFARDIQARTLSMTDAAGASHVSSFDEIGRLVSLARQKGAVSEASVFSYEASGAGRLIGVTDPSSSQAFEWSDAGLPVKKTQTMGAVSLEMSYAYDDHGQRVSATYPSGMVVGYAWTGGRVSSVTVNGQALISAIQYRPFSADPVAWEWASGGSYQKTFDAEGRISGVTDTGVSQQTVAFDAGGRLSSLTDTGLSLAATYKLADQIESVSVNGGVITYGFDANWNRNAKTEGGVTETIYMTSQTNRPYSVSRPGQLAQSVSYDANYNVISNGRGVYSYDLAGNLATAVAGGQSAAYAHNAFRQRVSKMVDGVKTLFLYDEEGNLAGEYDAAGAVQIEHIYLGSLPIGASVGGSTRQVHTDYLGTPRAITQGGVVVWKWEMADPFGGNAPSVQAIVYNPRFAGQYFDSETGLHYNHHRTYDPKMGRYMQPDPLGLAAGKNPFNYVNQNPLNATDRKGLDLEIIHLMDSHGIDHMAVFNSSNDLVSETSFTPGGNSQLFTGRFVGAYIIGALSPGLGLMGPIAGFALGSKLEIKTLSRDDFFAKFQGSRFKYRSITLKTTQEQDKAFRDAMAQMSTPSGGRPQYYYGWKFDSAPSQFQNYVACASLISNALHHSLGLPLLSGQTAGDVFESLKISPEFNKIKKSEIHPTSTSSFK